MGRGAWYDGCCELRPMSETDPQAELRALFQACTDMGLVEGFVWGRNARGEPVMCSTEGFDYQTYVR